MRYFETEGGINDELNLFLEEEERFNIEIEKNVLEMLNDIKKRKFDAIKDYSLKFDNFELNESNFRVKKDEIEKLASEIDPALKESFEIAIERVKDFHKRQFQSGFEFSDGFGNKMGQKVFPIDSVGVYIPGGRALYPSTIYMTIIPAIIAGVKRIVVFSPPRTFAESKEACFLLSKLGIEEIYRIGGAQAVLSASYGLPNLPRVDKIVGPGNIYVATAKKIVYGKVDIDMIAGPSEILVIADTVDKKDIKFIASDLLSQAEHDPLARAILVGTDKDFLLEVEKECYKTALELPENLKNNAVASLDNRGMIVKCSDMESVISLSNDLSSEHLEIFSDNPYPIFEKIRNAGSVFIGKYTPESVGDYIGGPNHVLPTSRSAKFFSPLGVYSFQKRTSFLEFTREGLSANYKHISNIARFENLISHARSAEIRFEK